jgi:hypothetical protein
MLPRFFRELEYERTQPQLAQRVSGVKLRGNRTRDLLIEKSVGPFIRATIANQRVDYPVQSVQWVNMTGPLKFDFAPVVWGTKPGEITPLPLPGGDRTGMALAINDVGQAVGRSGSCSNTVFPPFVAAPHAVLWDSDGIRGGPA